MQHNKRPLFFLVAASAFLVSSIAALNGGTALTASSWDTFVNWENSMLTSSYVQAAALLVLVWGIWNASHGKGFGFLSMTVGIIAIAILGPNVITALATATRPAMAVQHTQPAQQAVALRHHH